MALKLYTKDGYYAVKYTSLTRKDKSLFIYLNEKNPIICDGNSSSFDTNEDFRVVLFKEDEAYENILQQLDSLKDRMERTDRAYFLILDMIRHIECEIHRDYVSNTAKGKKADDVFKLLKNQYLADYKLGDRKQDYYCGITYDVDLRMLQHENDDDKEIKHCVAYLCDSNEVAADVEALMKETGFDTGDTETYNNGGKEFSRYVYLYRK